MSSGVRATGEHRLRSSGGLPVVPAQLNSGVGGPWLQPTLAVALVLGRFAGGDPAGYNEITG